MYFSYSDGKSGFSHGSSSYDRSHYYSSGSEDDSNQSESNGSDQCSSYESEQGELDSPLCYDVFLEKLMHAAEVGDEVAVESAIAKLSISCSTLGTDGDTALHLASLFGHENIVQTLLNSGADPNQRDNGGGLPLHDACASGHIGIVQKLLDAAPESLHITDNDGDTALHNAARGNHTEIVKLLLKRGATTDLDVVNLDGERPRDTTESSEIQLLLTNSRCE